MKDNSKNNTASRAMLILIFIILFLVVLDTQFQMIEKIWWYDSMLHILGGVWVGNLFIYIFSEKLEIFNIRENFFYTLSVILGFVALIGICWEFYEFIFDLTLGAKYALPLAQPGISDTMKDFANDLIGGTITAIIYYLR